MAPRKLTRRARLTPKNPGAEPLFADPDDRGGDDADDWDRLDDLDDLERLLDDLEASRRSNRGRAVRVAPGAAGPGPLARAWLARVEACGADEVACRQGEEALARGAISGLFVQRGRLTAEVGDARRYRIAVDFLPPSLALTAAVMARVNDARAALPAGERQREAVQDAILAAGPSIFPGPAQMSGSCTCPEGQPCSHVVAAVHGLGVSLDREPELLFALWGLSEPGPRRLQAIVVAPLPPDRPMLVGELGALFGIDLMEEGPRPESPRPESPRPTIASTIAADATTPAIESSPASARAGRGRSPRGAARASVTPTATPITPADASVDAPTGAANVESTIVAAPTKTASAAARAAAKRTPSPEREVVTPTSSKSIVEVEPSASIQTALPIPGAEPAPTARPRRAARAAQVAAPAREAAPAPVVAPSAPPRRIPPCERPEAEREYLRVLGLTNRTIDAWVREGVLGRTDRHDVFLRTAEANRRIAEFLAQ